MNVWKTHVFGMKVLWFMPLPSFQLPSVDFWSHFLLPHLTMCCTSVSLCESFMRMCWVSCGLMCSQVSVRDLLETRLHTANIAALWIDCKNRLSFSCLQPLNKCSSLTRFMDKSVFSIQGGRCPDDCPVTLGILIQHYIMSIQPLHDP